jgi:5-methyltetrahydropteroyltriglutamate--homocysteine methyltransferase
MPETFRSDHVGSLLRPRELLQARADQAAGRITEAQLHEIENASILRALETQRQVGISIFSDGEYRRSGWSMAFRDLAHDMAAVGENPTRRILAPWQGPHGDLATQTLTASGARALGGKLKLKERLTKRDADFLSSHAPGPWKITIPGPLSVAGQLFTPGITDRVYPTVHELANDVASIEQDEIRALRSRGVAYIQMDSLHYVERIAYPTIRAQMEAAGEDPEAYLDSLIDIDNRVLDAIDRTRVTVGLHMCRGNNRSAWHAEGSYEPIAEKAFNRLHVDRFLLEYDTDRAGGFEPLRFVPRDKMVVLGLISSKEPALESIELLQRRVDEAARFVPLERLAISPQCGFASTAPGNLLTWDEQRRKLELVVEASRHIWG